MDSRLSVVIRVDEASTHSWPGESQIRHTVVGSIYQRRAKVRHTVENGESREETRSDAHGPAPRFRYHVEEALANLFGAGTSASCELFLIVPFDVYTFRLLKWL